MIAPTKHRIRGDEIDPPEEDDDLEEREAAYENAMEAKFERDRDDAIGEETN